MKTVRIRKRIHFDELALVVLLAAYCQFLHPFNPDKSNAIITVGLAGIGIILNAFKGIKLDSHDVICFIVAGIAVLYSKSSEGLRYFLLLITCITWAKFSFNNLLSFIHCLVILMAVCSVPQLVQGEERITGFFSKSPTQAACVLFICESYLMAYMEKFSFDKKSLLLSLLCIVLIFFTGTRSNLLASFVIFAFFFLKILINGGRIRNKRQVFFVVLSVAGVVGILFAPYLLPAIMQKVSRSNAADSTNTRLGIYRILFEQIFRSPLTFLVGSKGGFTEEYLKQYLGVSEYFPGHQDYLVILCEYGLLGLVTVFSTFLKQHSGWMYFLMVFTVCSFHNILLSSTSMMLMFITMIDLERKRCTSISL